MGGMKKRGGEGSGSCWSYRGMRYGRTLLTLNMCVSVCECVCVYLCVSSTFDSISGTLASSYIGGGKPQISSCSFDLLPKRDGLFPSKLFLE